MVLLHHDLKTYPTWVRRFLNNSSSASDPGKFIIVSSSPQRLLWSIGWSWTLHIGGTVGMCYPSPLLAGSILIMTLSATGNSLPFRVIQNPRSMSCDHGYLHFQPFVASSSRPLYLIRKVIHTQSCSLLGKAWTLSLQLIECIKHVSTGHFG